MRLSAKHDWWGVLRSTFARAPEHPGRCATILLTGYIGRRRGFTISRLNVGDLYGQIGSRGVVWQLSTWRDPA